MKLVDLSQTIREGMPVYPGTEPPSLRPATTFAAEGYAETLLSMYSHTGTHLDAPGHMIKGAKTLDQLPVEQFFGLALIIDFPHCAGGRIELEQLQLMESKIAAAEFVIFHTGQYHKWGTPEYFTAYTVLSPQAAAWLAQFPLKGIGVDAISVDPLDVYEVHRILLANNQRILIENLCNLEEVKGEYCMLSVLPLNYEGADGSPVRAVAIEMATSLPED